MNLDFVLAIAHHLCLLLLISVLAGEMVLLRQPPSAAVLQSLGRLDALYGLSAVLLLAAGMARLVWGAKGFAFYSGNPFFWGKMAVFAVIGVMSIAPTVRFIRWRKAFGQGGALPGAAAWAATRRLASVQLHLLVLVVIAAAAMARGIGL